MRNPDPLKRSATGLPRLYQKYIGHDNNRDFFASTQAETENINRVLYHEWLPQILYNHHQSGPAGTVVWSSPQRDPYNYNLDPLLILGLQALGTHMHQRLAAEGKPGATMASGGAYDGWWNGGIRNTGNFHNIIAILTETIGSPTPMRIPLVIERQIPNRDLAYPIAPQEWRFRQSVDYSISFNRAVIDYATRNREHLLYNIYAMGRRAIARGSQDTWTPSPTRLRAIAEKTGGQWPRRQPRARRRALGRAAAARVARSARLHHPGGSTRLPHRHQVHQRPARSQRHRAARHAPVQRRGEELSAGLLRRDDRPGVPAARARHVRAAGSSQRHPLPRCAADASLRQRGVDARLPDGHRVRSRARAICGSVRGRHGLERRAAPRPRDGHLRRARLPDRPARQRRVSGGESAPGGGRVDQHDQRGIPRWCLECDRRAVCRRSRPTLASAPPASRPSCRKHGPFAPHALACGISTAARWNRDGRGGFSSSSSSPSSASSRRRWTPAI